MRYKFIPDFTNDPYTKPIGPHLTRLPNHSYRGTTVADPDLIDGPINTLPLEIRPRTKFQKWFYNVTNPFDNNVANKSFQDILNFVPFIGNMVDAQNFNITKDPKYAKNALIGSIIDGLTFGIGRMLARSKKIIDIKYDNILTKINKNNQILNSSNNLPTINRVQFENSILKHNLINTVDIMKDIDRNRKINNATSIGYDIKQAIE